MFLEEGDESSGNIGLDIVAPGGIKPYDLPPPGFPSCPFLLLLVLVLVHQLLLIASFLQGVLVLVHLHPILLLSGADAGQPLIDKYTFLLHIHYRFIYITNTL